MNVSERQHLMSNYAFSLLKIEKGEIRLKHCGKRKPPFHTFFSQFKSHSRDLPGGPVVQTLCSQGQGAQV